MGKLSANRRLGNLAGHLGGPITVSVGGVTIQVSTGGEIPRPIAQSVATSAEVAQADSTPAAPKSKVFTLADVGKHNTENDCWVVVNGMVLDVTNFMPDHPGGKKAIMIYAGRDATEEFLMMHKLEVIDKYAPETVIGTLKQ